MLENGELINDMERLANETEFIAGNVNTTLSAGTRALTNAKAHVLFYKIFRDLN